MRRGEDRSQNGSDRRVGAQEAGVRGDSRRRGTPPHSQPGTDRPLAPIDRRDRRFAGEASGLAVTTSHHRPPRLTSRRMTRRIMAPMVATMMDETMPAPRWMPNWGSIQGAREWKSGEKSKGLKNRQWQCPDSVLNQPP